MCNDVLHSIRFDLRCLCTVILSGLQIGGLCNLPHSPKDSRLQADDERMDADATSTILKRLKIITIVPCMCNDISHGGKIRFKMLMY
jgi:hypothetical protein